MKKLVKSHTHVDAMGRVDKVTFPAGLTFLNHEARGFKGASIYIWVMAGSRFESTKSSGVAHLLEHMVFKSGLREKDGISLMHTLEAIGVDVNAYTSKEYIVFELSCLKRQLKKVFPLLLDLVFDAEFFEEDFKSEKKVVAQELKEDLDSIELYAQEKLIEKAFSFPLGHSIGGSLKSLKELKLSQLKNFYKKYFTAERTIVSVVGSSDTDYFTNELSMRLKGQGTKCPWRFNLPKKLSKVAPGRYNYKRTSKISCLVMGFNAGSIGLENRWEMAVFDHYLTDGMSSRLLQELRVKHGLVYDLETEILSFSDKGLFILTANCAKKDLKKVEKLILDVFSDLAHSGVLLSELKKTKEQILGSWEMSFDDVEERNHYMGSCELFYGDMVSFKELKRQIKKVSIESLQKTIEQVIKDGPLTIIVGPS